MNKRQRVAVVGLGKIAQLKYLPYLFGDSRFEVIALSDHSRSLLDEAGRAYQLPADALLTDFTAIVPLAPDLVFILTHEHHAIAKALLQNGISVFCEKPFTWNSALSTELLHLAQARKKWIGVGYMKNHDAHVQWIRNRIGGSERPLSMWVQHAAGGVKRWTDHLHRIWKMPGGDKKAYQEQLSGEWAAALKHYQNERVPLKAKAARLLLELLSHDLALLLYLFDGSFSCTAAQAVEGNDGQLSLNIMGAICKLPFSIACTPAFQAPWQWKESLSLVYAGRFIRLDFGNPFFAQPETSITMDVDEGDGHASSTIALSREDPFRTQLSWVYEELAKNPEHRSYDSALLGIAVNRAIESIVEKI